MNKYTGVILGLLFYVSIVQADPIDERIDYMNVNGLYTIDYTDGLLTIDGYSSGDTAIRTECGEFVNDVYFGGPHALGIFDLTISKIALINTTKPCVGCVFVQKIDHFLYGHVGIVTSVGIDKFSVIDSNKNGSGLISEYDILFSDESILGFYDPLMNTPDIPTFLLSFFVNILLPIAINIAILAGMFAVMWVLISFILKFFIIK